MIITKISKELNQKVKRLENDKTYQLHENGLPYMGGIKLTGLQWKSFLKQ